MRYDITPVPKPRMTRRDKWKTPPRPCVARYRAFCDKVRMKKVPFPECGAIITFHIAMPKSWSQNKRSEMSGKPHQQTPDLDNLVKALSDAVHADDSKIWQSSACKLWAAKSGIDVLVIPRF